MTQPRAIAILDDEADRIARMLATLSRAYPGWAVATFDNAPDMVAWLAQGLGPVALIYLDHDLGPDRIRDGARFDPGTGRDVADALAELSPTCPVLIHTTNALAAPGMELALADSGWKYGRVVPYGDLEWIEEAWLRKVRALLKS